MLAYKGRRYLTIVKNGINDQSTFKKNLEKAKLKVISMLGQTVLEQQNVSGNTFNFYISNLSKEIYVIEVADGNSVFNTKFVKE